MRKNKKYYGLIAGVMALALATPFVGYNIAKADKLYDDVVAWYDFDGGALTNVKGGSQAVAIVSGLGDYTGEVKFDANRDSSKEGKSLKLDGGYGIKLNQQNLGENFSVSLWVKPETKLVENQSVLFLGYHNPEMWYAVSGDRNNTLMKFWYDYKPDFSWVTKTFATYAPSEWHHIVITGDGNTIKSYYDGQRISEGNEAFTPLMSGENQDVYIGANNWDRCFNGLVDDVMVYDRTISEIDIERLYTGKSLKEVEEETGVVDYDNYLVASYSFEDGIGDAKAITTGIGSYSGELEFVDGVEGKAIATNGYGIDLGNKVQSTDFTISFFAKPNKSQANNQVMMLMGYHAPEHWTAISGDGGDQTYKLWGRTDGAETVGNAAPMSWTTIGNPSVPNNRWSLITLVGTDGKLDMYVDGVKAASGAFNNPLCGKNESIYFGANNWDPYFDGQFDEIKIYNRAMTADAVEKLAQEYLNNRLQVAMDSNCSLAAVLGKNESGEHIRYNLELPATVLDTAVTWTSSKPEVINEKGEVTFGAEAVTVTLKADAELDGKKGHTQFEVTVDPLDKTNLLSLIETARSYDLSYMTEASAALLNEAIAEGEQASNFEQVEYASERIAKAIELLEPTEEYDDPFDFIPETDVTYVLAPNKSETIFVLPNAVKNMVEVEFVTGDDQVVAFEDGVIEAKGIGTTIVTAKVTAKSDGFEMDYSTAVDVKSEPIPAPAPSAGASESGQPTDESDQPSSEPGQTPGSSPAGSSSSGSSSSSSAGSSTSGSSSSSSAGSSSSDVTSGTVTTPATGTQVADQTTIADTQTPTTGEKPATGSQTKPGKQNDTTTAPSEETSDEVETTTIEDETTPTTGGVAEESQPETVEDNSSSEETIPETEVPQSVENAGLSPLAVVGIILGAVAGIALLGFALFKTGLLTIFK